MSTPWKEISLTCRLGTYRRKLLNVVLGWCRVVYTKAESVKAWNFLGGDSEELIRLAPTLLSFLDIYTGEMANI